MDKNNDYFLGGLHTMADVAVKKASEQGERQEGAVTRQGQGDVSRSDFWGPFSSLSPAEFFSSNPFSLMRRLSEDMDRTFGRFWKGEGGGSTWAPAIEVR